jgi:H+/Cl- antiporter ClcA
MVLVRSVLGGTIGLLVLAALWVLVGYLNHEGTSTGWDPVSLYHRLLFWVLVVLFFALGALVGVRLSKR